MFNPSGIWQYWPVIIVAVAVVYVTVKNQHCRSHILNYLAFIY